jgi:hypothetical protein
MEIMSKEDRPKLKYPGEYTPCSCFYCQDAEKYKLWTVLEYWNRDPSTWGGINPLDRKAANSINNKYNSHITLGDELRCLKQFYSSTHLVYNEILNVYSMAIPADEF